MDSGDIEPMLLKKDHIAIMEKSLEDECRHCRNLHHQWMVENARFHDREMCVLQLEMEVTCLADQIYSLIAHLNRLQRCLEGLDRSQKRE